MRPKPLQFRFFHLLLPGVLCSLGASTSWAQSGNAQPVTPAPTKQAPTADPHGEVLMESHGAPPAPGQPSASQVSPQEPVAAADAKVDLSDAQRSALLITSYDLDSRLNPAQSTLNMRAQVTVQNTGTVPLSQLALQISSSLHWESATLVSGASRTKLVLAQHQLDTDADHTGAETEAILSLPTPLAAGDTAKLDLFYSGTLVQSAGRLQRLGASAAQQANTDWDAVTPAWTGVRGFGNVLWYPVASPQLFFGDGNTLFEAIGRTRLREEQAKVQLHLSVEYKGSAPAAAYFCGRRASFQSTADDPDAPTSTGSGIAVATFPSEPLGFRTPSLFLMPMQEQMLAPNSGSAQPTSSTSPAAADQGAGTIQGSFMALDTNEPANVAAMTAAADRVAPLLREWLGPQPLSAVTVLDHEGQPFQDGPLLVAPVAALETSPQAPLLVQTLTSAWVQTGQPWIDEGLSVFFGLLWTERNAGPGAANAQLNDMTRPLALVEPATFSDANAGQPLISAYDELYYRRKAAAVWWMLRGLVGDGNLHQAIEAWRVQPLSHASAADQATGLEHLLEHLSGKDLDWFFADWVLRDRGLPDLTITNLNAAAEPAVPGHAAGWLVAVTVRNEGAAAADVPLLVHSGTAAPVEQRIHIAGLSTTTKRVLVEATPTSVQVNDGSTPEQRESQHSRDLNLAVR